MLHVKSHALPIQLALIKLPFSIMAYAPRIFYQCGMFLSFQYLEISSKSVSNISLASQSFGLCLLYSIYKNVYWVTGSAKVIFNYLESNRKYKVRMKWHILNWLKLHCVSKSFRMLKKWGLPLLQCPRLYETIRKKIFTFLRWLSELPATSAAELPRGPVG